MCIGAQLAVKASAVAEGGGGGVNMVYGWRKQCKSVYKFYNPPHQPCKGEIRAAMIKADRTILIIGLEK